MLRVLILLSVIDVIDIGDDGELTHAKVEELDEYFAKEEKKGKRSTSLINEVLLKDIDVSLSLEEERFLEEPP